MVQIDFTTVLMQLVDVLLPLLMAFAGYLSYQGSQWVKQKIKHDALRVTLEAAHTAVMDTVAAGGNAALDGLRRAAEDGVITTEELSAIRTASLAAAKKQAGASVIKSLEQITSDPDAWLWTKIQAEARVNQYLGEGDVDESFDEEALYRALAPLTIAPDPEDGA